MFATAARSSAVAAETRPRNLAVLMAVGQRMMEPCGQRSMLQAAITTLAQGLAAHHITVRLSLPESNPWQVEYGEAGHVATPYLEAYRKAEVVQQVWDSLHPAVVAQWCRSSAECCDQLADGEGHAVCTTSFVCVPIVLGAERLGVLHGDLPLADEALLWECVRVLGVVAGWIAYDCLARGLLPAAAGVTPLPARPSPPSAGLPGAQPAPGAAPDSASLHPPAKTSLRSHIRSIEREAIEKALSASGGNMSAAARQLGITPRMMRYKLKILSIPNVRPSRKRRE